MWRHAVLQHGCFYSNGNQYSFMQASFYIIVRNGFFMNFSIRGSSAWWSRARMVRVTALDIQVSLHNPTAILEDSMTSLKTLYLIGQSWGITLNENQSRDISSAESQKGVIADQKMFHWEPEGRYCCTNSMAIAPFWFSTEHHWCAITPFWLSTEHHWCAITPFWLSTDDI